MYGEDLEVCGLDKVMCLAHHADFLRMLAFPTEDIQKELEDAGLQCNCKGGEWQKTDFEIYLVPPSILF